MQKTKNFKMSINAKDEETHEFICELTKDMKYYSNVLII